MRVAVVGAGGFVGRAAVERLRADGHEVISIVRSAKGVPGERQVNDLDGTDWSALLSGVDAAVHLAARVHMMRDDALDPLAEFRRVNRDGALRVARGAVEAGVKRFVLLSTIKVNGEETSAGRPFRADDPANASDPHGISKAEAEAALLELGRSTGMEVVVIRPPLVYGPGVRGNFRSMIKWLGRGLPLPLGAVTVNRRSFVGLDNLVDLIRVCLGHPKAAGEIFLAGDGQDLSTTELLKALASAMGRKVWLVPVPPWLIVAAARMTGKGAAARRLVGNLHVDIGKARELLGWSPPVSIDGGLRRTLPS